MGKSEKSIDPFKQRFLFFTFSALLGWEGNREEGYCYSIVRVGIRSRWATVLTLLFFTWEE